MTLNDYQKEQMRTAPVQNYKEADDMLLNAVLGMSGEAGQVADILKKYKFQGHELNKEHLKEEIGDVLWYVSLAASALDCQLDQIAEINAAKLRSRYPDGFENEKSINRVI